MPALMKQLQHKAWHSVAFAVAVLAVSHVTKMSLLVCKIIPQYDYFYEFLWALYLKTY